MKKRWIFAILCLFWMLVIFQFSASQGEESAGLSDRIAQALCQVLSFVPYNDTTIFVIRKLAHFSEYAILGFLYYQWISTYALSKKTSMLISVLLVIGYATTDEVHQLFVDGRSGQFKDVCIDSSGGLVGVGISAFMNTWYEKYKGNV